MEFVPAHFFPLFLQPLSKALHENTKYHDDRRIPPTDGSWRAEVWEEEANRGLSVFWHLLISSPNLVCCMLILR